MVPDPELVSVVLAVRDGERTIDRTLRSARAQTHTKMELIVVDDGSTDATATIVQRHVEQDTRVRLVQIPPTGVSGARNVGIAQAAGEYLALLDADDLWHPDKTARQLARFRAGAGELAAVWSFSASIDGDDRIVGELLPFDRETMARTDGWVLLPMVYRYFPGGSSVMFRTSSMVESGCFDPSHPVSEDLAVMLRVAERGQIGVVEDLLVGYRQVGGSLSSVAERNLRAQLPMLRELRGRVPWVPKRVLRWSKAGRYVQAASGAMRSGHRLRGVGYGIAAVVRDPAVVLHPHALPRAFGFLARGGEPSQGEGWLFPDDLDVFVKSRPPEGIGYRWWASVERRRRSWMQEAELLSRAAGAK